MLKNHLEYFNQYLKLFLFMKIMTVFPKSKRIWFKILHADLSFNFFQIGLLLWSEKITKAENKIPHINGLVTNTVFDTKIEEAKKNSWSC